ncbi:endo-1,4-beta-xylanase [Cellulomonas phragmiteti]|uniref:endo-1,4-beta-xylanase n=1 Tax=Cellulomonas phragmiteti TaxID=478780 RepID=UPI003642FEF7
MGGGWTSAELGWIGARVGSFTMPEADVVLETTFRPQMASLKHAYRDYFDVGNIYSNPQTYAPGSPNSATVDRHYGVMTAENNMKPDQLLPNDNIDPRPASSRSTSPPRTPSSTRRSRAA